MQDLRVDIVSDVVCPWCAIGYKRLERALSMVDRDVAAAVVWHPFELNPDMPPGGQDLHEHVLAKYGASREQSEAGRTRLSGLAAELGLEFRYGDDARIYNTFQAHQLLHWALLEGRQAPLGFALFEAYFTEQRAVDEPEVLLAAAEAAGLDRGDAAEILADGRYAQTVRELERFWLDRGVAGVPAFVFDRRFLVSGAQPPEVLAEVIERALVPAGDTSEP